MARRRAKVTTRDEWVDEFTELWKDAPYPPRIWKEKGWWEQFFQVVADCGMYQWFKSCNGKVH